MRTYYERLVDVRLARLFSQMPAVMIVGPRACGKTTTARRLVTNIARLDQPEVAELFRNNPDAALIGYGEPLLLDEWQEVPEVLGAIKRAVDDGEGVGRFLLTGSASDQVTTKQWPGTGRVSDLAMSPLTMREVTGKVGGRLFLDRLGDDDEASLMPPDDGQRLGLLDYIDLALQGGFPEPLLTMDSVTRADWFDSYVSRLVQRDAMMIGTGRDPARLRRYLEALALNTAGVVDDTTLSQAAGVDRATADAYSSLLEALFVLRVVPAWWSNRMTRLVKMPKRYLVDSALMAAILRLDSHGIIRDPALLGRMIDTFVAAQIIPELELAQGRPRFYHLRDQGGRHEIDVLIEYGGNQVAAIEIKSAARVDRSDARHLEWLRDKLGDRFVAGVVLHTGPLPHRLSERIIAAPVSTLWA